MIYKPTTRLFVVKFLGLFGGGSLQKDQELPRVRSSDERATSGTNLPAGSKLTVPEDSLASHRDAIDSSSKRVVGLMLEKGIPGLTVCVSKRGQIVWSAAFGFCDVENQVECKPEAKMRIASISKPLFVATVVAPMIEQNKLDIKSSIHKHLTLQEFPKQKYNDRESDITVEQLLSHTSGIKHYEEGKLNNELLRPIGSAGSKRVYQCDDQYNRLGFFQRATFRRVIDALEPFKDGPLASEPGKYKYTTYGYTLLSAVAEKVHQQTATDDKSKSEQIEEFWTKVLLRDWDMQETSLDQDEPVLSNRARYYLRSAFNGGLINAPYTDNSVKWAGGGIISTTRDLAKFGASLVDSYKSRTSAKLKRETVELLWKEVQESYGLGFQIKTLNPSNGGERRAIYHLGNALGASSALIIYPEKEIVVAMLTNLGSLNLLPVCLYIADRFAQGAN